ncbi:MAG: cellulose synthase subunit BcsC-related outer membrane protein [Succinivibrio sp.]|nr:cellulose synthase subunit BcsC-related outer membrane protein [Succinivibrio sp.]
MKLHQMNKPTALALALTAVLGGTYMAVAADASNSAYLQDRSMMSAGAAGAHPSSQDTAAPGATEPQVQPQPQAQVQQAVPAAAAPGAENSTNIQAAPASRSDVNNAAHSFTPQNGSGEQAQAGGQNMVDSLMKQAKFWHDKFQPSLAKQSLNRVLIADPDNAEALYLLSLWSSETGDAEGAEKYRRRLEQAHPRDPHLQTLSNEKDLANLSQDQLHRARTLAAAGNIPGALQAYRSLFTGAVPPRSLMNEYYLTMSGDPSRYDEAVQGVASYIRDNPSDTDAKITYGKLLTYNEATRRDGIEVLNYYARDSREAEKALRQALVWLAPEQTDEKYYQSYLARHPDDVEVRNRFATSIADQMNTQAFSNFTKQNVAQAKAQFETVLKRDPDNAAAHEGLGYLLQSVGEFDEAADHLAKAAKFNAANRAKLNYDSLFARARGLEKKGDIKGAVAITDQMRKQGGGDADALSLYRATLNRQLKRYSDAEADLRSVLEHDPQNKAAGEILYYVLRESGKNAEAKELLATLPDDLRTAIAKREAVPADPATGLRKRAQTALAAGDDASALAALQKAQKLKPRDAWIRHDLAVLYHRRGDEASAQSELSSLLAQGTGEALFAAASLQSEFGDRRGAAATRARISPSYNPRGLAQLRRSIAVRGAMEDAENYLKSGQKAAAVNTLNGISAQAASLSSGDLGHLAYLYLRAGDSARARSYADEAAAKGRGSANSLTDLADVLTVYNELGLYDQARAIAGDQRLRGNTDPLRLAQMQNGSVIRRADDLRKSGRSADAYDVLYAALQTSPRDPGLMSAMARIYQDNGKLDEAEAIYDRVLADDPADQGALTGAINTALSNHHEEKAMALATRLEDSADPNVLLLKGRVAAENHQYRSAISYLRQSKSILEGSPYLADPYATGAAVTPVQSVAVRVPNNPFRNDNELTSRNETNTAGLPWETTSSTAKADPAVSYMFDTDAIDRRRTLTDVNTMLAQLYELTSGEVGLRVMGRQKDGEDGLSTVNGIRGELEGSLPLFDDNRLTATVSVGAMKAGRANADSNSKFGAVPVMAVLNTIVNRINNFIDQASQAVSLDTQMVAQGGSAWAVKQLAEKTGMSESSIQALAARSHIDNAVALQNGILTDENKLMNYFGSLLNVTGYNILSILANSSDSSYGKFSADDSLSDQGAEVNLAVSGHAYRADIGSSPLGKDNSTIVGGFYIHPHITQNTELRVNLERRAVSDSVLSYYGVKDPYSGMFWGGVTRNGGSVGFGWDNGSYGAYGSGSYYYYTGENVRSNHMYGLNAGFYTRPINNSVQQLQVGADLNYMNYSNNQNHFTFGNGGYFSPQDYYSVAIPVNWKRIYNDNLELQLGASIGYQSYTSQSEDYFPNSADQAFLEAFQSLGLVKETRFPAEDKHGMSGSLRFGLDYRLTDAFKVSGEVNYNTFGDYKEANEMVYFKYLTGVDSFL